MVKYAHFDDSSINEPWGTSDFISQAKHQSCWMVYFLVSTKYYGKLKITLSKVVNKCIYYSTSLH